MDQYSIDAGRRTDNDHHCKKHMSLEYLEMFVVKRQNTVSKQYFMLYVFSQIKCQYYNSNIFQKKRPFPFQKIIIW